tara:strand:- start:746 stop:904 length:159 start_codon:yes stop_codon:yes gene_type:complete
MRPLLAFCLLFLFLSGCTEADCKKAEKGDGAVEMAEEVTASGDVDMPDDVTK